MRFRDYIEQTHVFTTDDAARQCDLSATSLKTSLGRAVALGRIDRPRRGLYVSKTGRFSGVEVDPFFLLSALDDRSTISFHSALEAHGIAHNLSTVCQFRSSSVKTPFVYSGTRYLPFNTNGKIRYQKLSSNGMPIRVTTFEQTLLDCLEFPELCGGLEEALTSITLLPYIDQDELLELLHEKPSALAARTGWLLDLMRDKWRITRGTLDALSEMTGQGPYRLDKRTATSHGWSRKWKLCLPAPNEEIESWLL